MRATSTCGSRTAGPCGWTYDVLVVTAGSWSRVLPIPGLAEHGIGFKTVQEAIYLRNHVLSRLDVATQTQDPELRRAALTFVFVGAGYAGVEALGELEDLARDAMRNYPKLASVRDAMGPGRGGRPDPARASGATSRPTRRPGWRNATSRSCWTRGSDSAEEGTIRLSDGQAFAADTLVWTAGVKPSPLAGMGALPVDEHGRIVVDDHLRVVGVPDAWAAGDIAAVPDRTTGGLAPPTAQHAMREGRRLGRNVTATILGGELAPFVWKNVGGVCSLGRYKGVANVFGVQREGVPRVVPAPLVPPVGDADDRTARADRDRLDDRAAVPARHHAVRLVRGSARAVPSRGRFARSRYAPLRRCFWRSLAACSALWLRAMSGISWPPASSSAAHRVRSRIEMMPTTFARSTTGRWRMLRDAMISAASAMSVFGETVVEVAARHAVDDLDAVRVAARGDQVHDVPLRHDALELLAFEDDDRGDAVGPHDLRDVGERVVGARPSSRPCA